MNQEIKSVVYKTLSNHFCRKDALELLRITYNLVANPIKEDLTAFAKKDMAAKRCWRYVFESYATSRAVVYHRISHALDTLGKSENSQDVTFLEKVARKISEEAKCFSGIEIHPAAQIGAGCVIDHGWATVIGETVVIGKDAYLLQCVTLGATEVECKDDSPIQRHPIIGDRVQICGHVNIFGHINVGDDVIIRSYAVVTKNVPSNSIVRSGFNQIFPRSQ